MTSPLPSCLTWHRSSSLSSRRAASPGDAPNWSRHGRPYPNWASSGDPDGGALQPTSGKLKKKPMPKNKPSREATSSSIL